MGHNLILKYTDKWYPPFSIISIQMVLWSRNLPAVSFQSDFPLHYLSFMLVKLHGLYWSSRWEPGVIVESHILHLQCAYGKIEPHLTALCFVLLVRNSKFISFQLRLLNFKPNHITRRLKLRWHGKIKLGCISHMLYEAMTIKVVAACSSVDFIIRMMLDPFGCPPFFSWYLIKVNWDNCPLNWSFRTTFEVSKLLGRVMVYG